MTQPRFRPALTDGEMVDEEALEKAAAAMYVAACEMRGFSPKWERAKKKDKAEARELAGIVLETYWAATGSDR